MIYEPTAAQIAASELAKAQCRFLYNKFIQGERELDERDVDVK